jgi:hypothetical protein
MTTSHHTSDCTKMHNPQKPLSYSSIPKVRFQRCGASVTDDFRL